jgi:formylglycine-generating enzyme required for sulfatase activity
MEWYRKAADHGLADAQYNVGVLYDGASGVPRDIEQAKIWYQKAADQGYAPAKAALQRLQSAPAPSAQSAPNPRPVASQAENFTASASPLTATQELALKPGDSFKECGDCPEMVVVPPGSFMMGSPDGEGHDNERPQHEVTIAKPVAIGKFELTFDEWDACVAHGGCALTPKYGGGNRDAGWGRGRRPVIEVSWDDASAYVKWLSGITGKPYRLLSEAEYEYAAQAGTRTKYPWGDNIMLDGKPMANCDGCGSELGGKRTMPVGSFPPNAFGLYDMIGNVWEWTADCWHEQYQRAPVDGSAWTTGNCGGVIRGGSWYSGFDGVRSAFRAVSYPSTTSLTDGFRVARSLAL